MKQTNQEATLVHGVVGEVKIVSLTLCQTLSSIPVVSEGDWKIAVNSSSSLQAADVAIVVYGSQGNSGAIVLAAPVQNGPLFQESSMDEFKVSAAAHAGRPRKIVCMSCVCVCLEVLVKEKPKWSGKGIQGKLL